MSSDDDPAYPVLDDELGEHQARAETAAAARPPAGDQHVLHIPVRQEQISGGARNGYCATILLSASNPVAQLLGRDYGRAEAVIVSCDQAAVLAQTREMAQAAANSAQAAQADAGSVPSGAYLPAGVPVTVRNCDELWAAQVGATANRISVIVSRTGPEHADRPHA